MKDITIIVITAIIGIISGVFIYLFLNFPVVSCISMHLQHPEYDGYYFSDPPIICIYYDNLTELEVKYMISHELGHWVWDNRLNNTIREEWLSINFTEYPTKYAETNPYENFAESFAYNCFNLKLPEKQREFFLKYNLSC